MGCDVMWRSPEVQPSNDSDGASHELPENAAQKRSRAVVCCPCTYLCT